MTAKMSWEDSRIYDGVRDSKILRDAPSKFNHKSDTFMAESRHHLKNDDQQIQRDLPRVSRVGIGDKFQRWHDSLKEANRRWVRSYLPIFSGTSSKRNLLGWIDTVDSFFEEMQTPEKLKCQLAYYAFEGAAEQWWLRLQHQRAVEGESKITLWARMKYLLINDFWPILCSMKCPAEVHNSSQGKKHVCGLSVGRHHTESVPKIVATTPAENTLKQIIKIENAGDRNKNDISDGVFVNEQLKEMVTVKPASCSTICPLRSVKTKQEEKDVDGSSKEDASSNRRADRFMHVRCSTEVPFESHSSKQRPLQAVLSEHIVEVDQPLTESQLNLFMDWNTPTIKSFTAKHEESAEKCDEEKPLQSKVEFVPVTNENTSDDECSKENEDEPIKAPPAAIQILVSGEHDDHTAQLPSIAKYAGSYEPKYGVSIQKIGTKYHLERMLSSYPCLTRNTLTGQAAHFIAHKIQKVKLLIESSVSVSAFLSSNTNHAHLIDGEYMASTYSITQFASTLFDPGGLFFPARMWSISLIVETFAKLVSFSWNSDMVLKDKDVERGILCVSETLDSLVSCLKVVYEPCVPVPIKMEIKNSYLCLYNDANIWPALSIHLYVNVKVCTSWNGLWRLCFIIFGSRSNHSYFVYNEKSSSSEATFACTLSLSWLLFDFKGNQLLKRLIKGRTHRMFSNMKSPSFLVPSSCTFLDFGKLPPYILTTRVVPWHMCEMMVFDMEYSTGVSNFKRYLIVPALVTKIMNSKMYACFIAVVDMETPIIAQALSTHSQLWLGMAVFTSVLLALQLLVILEITVGYGWKKIIELLCEKRAELGHWRLLNGADWLDILVTERASKICDTIYPSRAHGWRIDKDVVLCIELVPRLFKYREDDGAHILLTKALCISGKHDEVLEKYWQCSFQTDIGLNLACGQAIPWEGWNDGNNSNVDDKIIIDKLSVVTMSLCLSISSENGRFKGSLKLFHKIVNGLDPPMDIDGAQCGFRRVRSRTSFFFFRRGDGDDVGPFIYVLIK